MKTLQFILTVECSNDYMSDDQIREELEDQITQEVVETNTYLDITSLNLADY